MNRREFLLRSSLLASAGLLARSSLCAEPPAPAAPATVPVKTPAGPMGPLVTEFRPLRRNVGIFTGRGGTIGWLSDAGAMVVVDTQFVDSAAVCLAGLPGRGDRMIDAVLNTHHHADHTGGNGIFKPASRTIVAQANVPKLMFAAAEKNGTLDKQTYPDTTYPDVWRRDFDTEIVTAQYFGAAHTSGDVIIQFEKANVVHMGDLVFNRMYPVIDRPGGASIHGWITRLKEAVKSYPQDAIYVFGHGNPKFGVTGGHAELNYMQDYLTALITHVEKSIASGRSKSQILAMTNFPGFPDMHAPLPNRLQGNLAVAYDELTEKQG